jgi:hypothetical protein
MMTSGRTPRGFIRLQTLVSLGFCSLVQFKLSWWPIVIEHILCALILWTSKSCFGNVERPSDRINKGSQHCCGNLGWDFGAQQVGLLPPLWPWCHWGPFKKCDLLKPSSSSKRRVWRGSWLYIHSNFPTKLCSTNHLCIAICLCVCVSYYQKWAREWTYSIAVLSCFLVEEDMLWLQSCLYTDKKLWLCGLGKKQEYQQSEGVYQQYEKSRKWELFKVSLLSQFTKLLVSCLYKPSSPWWSPKFQFCLKLVVDHANFAIKKPCGAIDSLIR